jgi:hypothetical protein
MKQNALKEWLAGATFFRLFRLQCPGAIYLFGSVYYSLEKSISGYTTREYNINVHVYMWKIDTYFGHLLHNTRTNSFSPAVECRCLQLNNDISNNTRMLQMNQEIILSAAMLNIPSPAAGMSIIVMTAPFWLRSHNDSSYGPEIQVDLPSSVYSSNLLHPR